MAPQMLWCLVATLVPGIRLWGGSFVRLWVVGLRNPINMIASKHLECRRSANFSPQKVGSIFFTFETAKLSKHRLVLLLPTSYCYPPPFPRLRSNKWWNGNYHRRASGNNISQKSRRWPSKIMNLANDDASPPVQKKRNQLVVTTENHQPVFLIKISGLVPKKNYRSACCLSTVVPQENSKNPSGFPHKKILQIASYHVFQDPMFYLQISSKF